ncbi:hypothetical protein Tco_0444568 [Tanacetum coccineum]
MIGSLMYLTASRPDIRFAVCACSRFQVNPKTSHLSAVKRIFRYLKGKPKLGLWYPRVSSFDLEAYSDSDYAGANLDRKSTTGGCQFLGRRLISWQCKKQTIVATSTTEAEYVVAANCCGQVLWIQNQMLDYGFNFMNTKIYIDNESTICIVKNPVFHSKTKHIAIRHHFIRDAYEKKLIQVLKIHTDDNVADLLTKAFDVSRFQFLVLAVPVSISEASIRSDLLFDDADGIDSLPNQAIFDAIQLMGYEGDLTKVSGGIREVSDQAKEIQHLKAQIKKHVKPVITHHRAWMKSVSLKQRLGRKSAKAKPSVHTDPLFDEMPEDTLDYMKTEVSTDKEKVSTDRPIVSTDGSKVSTDKEKDSTSRTLKVLMIKLKEEGLLNSQTPTYTIFGDDETIAQVLLNMSQAKAVSREKEKGVEFKDIEETERPRPTSTRSLLTLKPLPKIDPKDKGKKKIEEEDESESESDGIPEAEKKFKQLANDKEMARKARIEAYRLLAEKLQEEEREKFTIEEKHRNFKHSDLKTKKFEEIQALYEKIKRSDEDFISIGFAEDERLIKEMNEKGIDSSKNESVKEEDKEEEGTKKRKGGHIKMIARKKKRSQLDVDTLDEHKKCLKIVTFESILDRHSTSHGGTINIFDRQDLFHLYDLMREQFSEVTLDGFELILWGDLKIMMESSIEGNEQSDFWSSQQDWNIITWMGFV